MKLRAVPHMAHPEHVEVEGSGWDLLLFVVGLVAILVLLVLLAPGPA